MSRITLDLSCPECYSEQINIAYNENEVKTKCKCLECDYVDYMEDFLYLIDDFEIK